MKLEGLFAEIDRFRATPNVLSQDALIDLSIAVPYNRDDVNFKEFSVPDISGARGEWVKSRVRDFLPIGLYVVSVSHGLVLEANDSIIVSDSFSLSTIMGPFNHLVGPVRSFDWKYLVEENPVNIYHDKQTLGELEIEFEKLFSQGCLKLCGAINSGDAGSFYQNYMSAFRPIRTVSAILPYDDGSKTTKKRVNDLD